MRLETDHSPRRRERLEARVTRSQKQLIERAAHLRGSSLTDFLVQSAQEAAAKTIQEFEILHLRDGARDVFVNAILNPPPPNKALRAAAARYGKREGL
ncbi:MAG: DUF1778 domain-containing protein [Acidobacteriota bacterium]